MGTPFKAEKSDSSASFAFFLFKLDPQIGAEQNEDGEGGVSDLGRNHGAEIIEKHQEGTPEICAKGSDISLENTL